MCKPITIAMTVDRQVESGDAEMLEIRHARHT